MALPLAFVGYESTDSESDQLSTTSSDHLLSSGGPLCLNAELETRPSAIQAVIVNTNSVMLRANVPQYLPQSLTTTDAIFVHRPSSMSKVFGIPLIARSLRSEDCADLAPFLREAQVPNLLLRTLYRNCDVTICDNTAGLYGWDQGFGSRDSLIDGPVILARQDQKPLHPLHAQMILEYAEEHMDTLFDDYHVERKRWRKRMEANEYREKVNEMRGDVEAMVKKGKMRSQWELFKEAHQGECVSVSNPWDI
jgi:hypothetical protein